MKIVVLSSATRHSDATTDFAPCINGSMTKPSISLPSPLARRPNATSGTVPEMSSTSLREIDFRRFGEGSLVGGRTDISGKVYPRETDTSEKVRRGSGSSYSDVRLRPAAIPSRPGPAFAGPTRNCLTFGKARA
jgi:hypothetical protein